MQGLFDQPLTFPTSDSTYKYNTVDLQTDLLLHVNANCERFEAIQDYASDYENIDDMHENIDFDMESDFFPRLRLMTNMTDASTDDMYDVCNYLYWAFMNNLDIIFADQLTDEDHNRITLTVNDNVFEKYEAQDELIAFPSFELFN